MAPSNTISAMCKPRAAVARGDAESCAACDTPHVNGIAWCVTSDLLFLETPAEFDRIEVVRVRREIDDADTARRAEPDDALVVMRRDCRAQRRRHGGAWGAACS